MYVYWIALTFLLTISFAWFEGESNEKACQLDPMYQKRIQRYFQVFQDGITEQMIIRAKQIMPQVCLYEIIDHKLYENCQPDGPSDHPYTLKALNSILPDLPDMKFAMNFHDVPRTFRRQCNRTAGQDGIYIQKACFCDPNFTISDHAHSYLYSPFIFEPIYEKLPILSPASIPECHNDIIIPSQHHFKAALHHDFPRSYTKWQEKKLKAVWRGGLSDIPWIGSGSKKIEDLSQRVHLAHKCRSIENCDAKASWIVNKNPQFMDFYRKNYDYTLEIN